MNTDPLFPDCPICIAVNDADNEGREISYEKLKEAFKKAPEMIFEDENNH